MQTFIGNKVYKRRQARNQDPEEGERSRRTGGGGNRGRQAQHIRPRRTSILNDNVNTLTPVPETEEEDEFIFTITNSRGETRIISEADHVQRERRTVGGGSGGGNRSPAVNSSPNRDKLTDAQKIGTDPPPSYDQVLTETRVD